MMKYLLFIMCLFVATVAFAETVPLLPLKQVTTFKNIDAPTQGGVTVAGSEFSLTAQSLQAFTFEITLPDGTLINAGNAEGLGFQWSTEVDGFDALFAPGLQSVTVSNDHAPPGNYRFKITPEAPIGLIHVEVIELAGLSGQLVLGPPNLTVEVNKPFPVMAALQRNGALQAGADVALSVTDQDGREVLTTSLLDDGVAPDGGAHDGVYSHAITLTNEGRFQLKADVSWTDPVTGRQYRGSLFNNLNIRSPKIHLSGEFSEHTLDEDNDGLIDSLVLTFAESAPRVSGKYSLTVVLENSSGSASIPATSRADNDLLPLAVEVPHDRLKALVEDGPYLVKALNIWSGSEIIGHWENFGTTQAYKLSDLERRNTLITGLAGDSGIDSDGDGDGRFEKLKVDMVIDTVLPGYYGVSADIKSADKNSFGDYSIQSIYLNKGKNTVPLYFLGSDIGMADLDGPYLIGNAFVYPNFKAEASILVDIVGQTGAYQCSQFAGCGSDMGAEIKRIAGILCDLQGHQLLVKLDLIGRLAKKHPDVAEKQLSALFTRAKALERSGSCPPAKGWPSDRQEQQ
jgi:hypothetical protein